MKALFFLLFLLIGDVIAADEPTIIKVGILDNFHFQPYITNEFGKHYINGVEVANFDLKHSGYQVIYKTFDYDRTHPMAVLASAEKLKAWEPDVILAPRNSNMFLLVKNAFKDILVISPFATSDKISTLPKNYYTLMLPDKVIAKALYHYVRKKFPGKGIYPIIQSDCKNCMDFGRDFLKYYDADHDKVIIPKTYLQSEITNLNIKRLMTGYKKGDIIFLPNTAYTTAILMLKITNFLNSNTIFLGGDGWGAWQNTEVGKLKANHPYDGFHFSPSSLEIKESKIITRFKKKYKAFFNREPIENAALISFNAIHSIIASLRRYGNRHQSVSLREKILSSYQDALKDDPNWYKFRTYAMCKVNCQGEKYVETVLIDGF